MSHITHETRAKAAIKTTQAHLEQQTPYRFEKLSDAIYHLNGKQFQAERTEVFKVLTGHNRSDVEGRHLFREFCHRLGVMSHQIHSNEERIELLDTLASKLTL